MNQIFKRFLTITFIFFYLLFLYFYGNNLLLSITIYTISLISFHEWISMQSKSNAKVFVFFILIYMTDQFTFINMYYISLLSLLIWIFLIFFMLTNPVQLKYYLRKYHSFVGILIFLILFLHLSNLYPINNSFAKSNDLFSNKFYLLMLIIFISFIDTFAYIVGKSIGKYKIVTSISPNKTLEGYIGSYILSLFSFIIFFGINNMIWTMYDLMFLSVFILLAFFGDLFISFAKRTYNVKDTGNILPGHGGLLDRLDSYLPALPLFYIWFMI